MMRIFGNMAKKKDTKLLFINHTFLYWILIVLNIIILMCLMTIAVAWAIKVADFKMNVIYPPSKYCGCDLSVYPAGSISDEVRSQCTIDCTKMRDDERSLTIGFLSIFGFSILYLIYELIKIRIKISIEKHQKTK